MLEKDVVVLPYLSQFLKDCGKLFFWGVLACNVPNPDKNLVTLDCCVSKVLGSFW